MRWMTERGGRRRRGFTLLEFVIVLLIIAVMVAVAVPRYIRTAQMSKANEALRVLAQLRDAAQRYYVQQEPNSYTNMTMADLDFDPAADVSGTPSFTYAVEDVTATTFTFRAEGSLAPLTNADWITLNESGQTAGHGVFAGI